MVSIRNFMHFHRFIAALALCGLLAQCQTTPNAESETRPAGENVLSRNAIEQALSGPVDFATHVRPILADKCVACHTRSSLPGRIDLTDRTAAIRSRALGGYIVPGAPEKSLFISQIGDAPAHLKEMPVVGNQVTAEEMDILRKWITEGAKWPAGPAGQVAPNP
jgi:mono/diheme cytochrome c family protein